MKLNQYSPTMTRAMQKELCAKAMRCKSLKELGQLLYDSSSDFPWRPQESWRRVFRRCAVKLMRGELACNVFKSEGNSKLKYTTFSTLPLFTCPGAGACGEFCFSFRAWRYPMAFIRQLQNTILIRRDPARLLALFLALPEDTDIRIYVDGDISDDKECIFWFNALKQRPDINAYNYSKSWPILLRNAAQWPTNLVMNLSGGSKHENNKELTDAMLSLPGVRGRFIAVPLEGYKGPKGNARYADRAYHDAVRASAAKLGYTNRVMSCPGKCYNCTKRGPACASHVFDDVTICIGIS